MVEDRKTLKKLIIRGDITHISNVTNINRQIVNRWFEGRNNNIIVEEAVKALLSKRQKEIQEKINTI